MDIILVFQEDQVTQEQINESRRKGEREEILQALNQSTYDQKKELRRMEYLTYTRRNKASATPS